jgi:hypothetical protein
MLGNVTRVKQNDRIKGDEVGLACTTHGMDKKCTQNLVGAPEGKNYSQELDADGKIILKRLLRKESKTL